MSKKKINNYNRYDHDDFSLWDILKQKKLRLSEFLMIGSVVFVIVAERFIPRPISQYVIVGGTIMTIFFTHRFIDKFSAEFSLYKSKINSDKR